MCAAPKEESPQQDSPEAKQQQPAHVEDDLSLEGFDGLTPEEDEQVPGNYADAMNPNSKLGKAVKAACAELEELNDLELEILNQAQDALKRLGVKGASIDALARPPQTKDKRVGLDETVEDEQTQQASSQGGEDSK